MAVINMQGGHSSGVAVKRGSTISDTGSFTTVPNGHSNNINSIHAHATYMIAMIVILVRQLGADFCFIIDITP